MNHREAAKALRGFIGDAQLLTMLRNCDEEEGEFFQKKLIDLATQVAAMPVTGETDGQYMQAIAHLHYFGGARANWYITEKEDTGSRADKPEDFQSQAFGLADLFGDGGELGYISIREIIGLGCELDLYWEPKSLAESRGEAAVEDEMTRALRELQEMTQ